ncbi:MAG: beta-(1-3)-glucosyl transferase, partial [Thiohalophilus sp.]
MYRLTNVVIGIAVALISISLWAYINQPADPPAWPERVTGFAFSPMRADFDPDVENYPSRKKIEQDLALLSGKTIAVRTYTVENIMAEVPALAKTHDLNVCLGAWLGEKEQDNAVEIQRFLRVAQES